MFSETSWTFFRQKRISELSNFLFVTKDNLKVLQICFIVKVRKTLHLKFQPVFRESCLAVSSMQTSLLKMCSAAGKSVLGTIGAGEGQDPCFS